MLKKLLCLIWGHGPWKTVAVTTCEPKTKSFKLSSGSLVTRETVRLYLCGGKVLTMTCDRCGTIVTIVN